MGCAIERDPLVFLFDQPLSLLDAKLRVNLRIEIKGLQQRLMTTTIYVTDDQVKTMTMDGKIVVMQAGRVQQEGTPLKYFDRPAISFVASFIGSPYLNLLPGTKRSGRMEMDEAMLLRPPGDSSAADNQPVAYYI